MNTLKQLYRDTIRQHAAEPVGFRKKIQPTHRYEGLNPQCGDRMEIFLEISSGMIDDISFDGEACTICMASASLMCKHLAGKRSRYWADINRPWSAHYGSGMSRPTSASCRPCSGSGPIPAASSAPPCPGTAAEKALKNGNVRMEKSVPDD